MSFLLHGFHPTFDALSSVADQSDVDAARTRVGRHVARCASCAETVAEIRAMGDGARALELPGAPAGLWDKIQRAAATEQGMPAPARETPAPDADAFKAAPALRPTTHVPSPMRRAVGVGAIALAAAAVIVALVLIPTSRDASLQAGTTAGRWRFTPEQPVPGSVVSVRYESAPDMPMDSVLLLLGGDPRQMDNIVVDAYRGAGLQDSLTVLRRAADGVYSGRFVFPASATALVVRLAKLNGDPPPRVMSTNGPVSRFREAIAVLVGSDARGRPSLAALTDASSLWGGGAQLAFSVSDTLIKYFPGEPIGYAVDQRVPRRRLFDDLVAYFKRGERQYVKFDARYMAQPDVSADHEIAMITFANRIDEPAEVRKWTMRLVREHPEDPRSLVIYANLLGSMLGRNGTIDSVRRALPLADTLWERNGHQVNAVRIASVAATVGDTAARRRWVLRGVLADAANFHGALFGIDEESLLRPEIRSAVRPLFQRRIERKCEIPAGKYPMWQGIFTWTENCRLGNSWAYAALSTIERVEGRPRAALALADSAVGQDAASNWCRRAESEWQRGLALLALGDTTQAVAALAKGVSFENWQQNARRDSIGAVLRPSIGAERWTREVGQARAEFTECVRRRDAERRAAQAARSAR